MADEIERKFLVSNLPPGIDAYPHNNIIQGYLRISEDGSEERVRRKGTRYSHTVKSGKGLIREETEKEISEEQFDELWPNTKNKRISKIRYDIGYKGVLIELDVYSGELEGLVVAEVEFESEEDSSYFIPPKWFGEEITQDERYKNKNLALSGMP